MNVSKVDLPKGVSIHLDDPVDERNRQVFCWSIQLRSFINTLHSLKKNEQIQGWCGVWRGRVQGYKLPYHDGGLVFSC